MMLMEDAGPLVLQMLRRWVALLRLVGMMLESAKLAQMSNMFQ